MARIIPVLDLDRLDQGASERRTFLFDLRTAARDVGFFYLSGHGISASEISDVLDASRRFFALPEADKLAIEMVKSSQFRGYTRAGGELTKGKADWREQLDIGVERPTIAQGPGIPAWTRLQGPNQWPHALPELKPALLAWQSKATQVAIRLLKAFALSLDQPEDAFDAIYRDEPNHRMKIVRYPGRDATGDDQGVGAHKDGGFLTLLLQDENKGLQVEYNGNWVNVDPIPQTLVVNIGELLELASNGYLRATVHRVVTPPPGVERISVPFFFSARLDATIPLLDLPEDLAAEARGPASDPDNPLFRDVGTNVLKSRLRSHPDVARRHYADLLEAAAAG
ncbi:isopenicillin N synthase family oxygenase [Mesorhizobium sp. M4B.F.Ca.ET.215.01.1.1]|uniref:isopenicillin N synthase family dioxygenase n=1 Tax=unclassified Mesorhizobium TaxID=325217 RepID=UPI000FD25D73|nr:MULTISPECIES: isopenicillin N synthase family oxygenase [unclassified Mesorhizobium]RUW23598.1 isopenicillin N synthase family oxygenase [Mesorhizobium sp. M4B.F.Ca.ET.013.02.1.1]RWF63328.1 MAG: isopenicillin N synthase family oxygenase [Mesorhizobium sp.]TGQ18639.1 isopenicillin N synthase family oxygenase [Mesorhizobium sp. M4B.F.Ca.ET.215.01.1.1]TGQ40299.1 isopenicillin N synthase family oxygenase [Mesorhizobium sp. M4B.F.Ca.ET.214.01.1.1]TGQ49105.1 isopenicillin N synthase family oxygen